MKKLLLAVLVFILSIVNVYASKSVSVVLMGSQLIFDQPPIIEEGRTLVPMRKIFEEMGADIDWDEETQSVTALKDGKKIIITINSPTAFVDGDVKKLDVPAKIINSRTLVPLRFIGESLDCTVDWDGENNIVYIDNKQSYYGNTNGNLTNAGYYAYQNDWIYYYSTANKGLCKMKMDGSSNILLSAEYASQINVIGEWIYYRSSAHLVKIKTDGSNRTVFDNVGTIANGSMCVVGDTIYYGDTWAHLYKMKTDGTNVTKIGNVQSLFFQVVDDWIYYNPEISPSGLTWGNICKVKTDGAMQSMLVDCSTYDFIISDNWIFYENQIDGQTAPPFKRGLYKIRLDGSGKKLIAQDINFESINVQDKWIYYSTYLDLYDNRDVGEFRRMDKDGKSDSFISQGNSLYLGVIGNNIIYKGENADILLPVLDFSEEPPQNGFGTKYDIFGYVEYEGEFKNGLYNGSGTLYTRDGFLNIETKYQGQFKDGKKSGSGNFYDSSGIVYSGEYYNDLENGKGIYYYENGAVFYKGEVKNGKFDGNGELYDALPDELVEKYVMGVNTYAGQFKNGEIHGKGTLYNANTGKVVYMGDFINGKFDGMGTFYQSDGIYYTGQFKADKYHGRGSAYKANGELLFEGIFENGELVERIR